MEYYDGRKKKSDKAKEKAGLPSQKHVRAYEARMEKKANKGIVTANTNKK